MTEAEWLACTDPRPMLRMLIGSNYPRVQAVETFPDCITSDRKLRLFACACYHRICHLLPDLRALVAVNVAERFADGIVSESERQRAETMVREVLNAMEQRWRASEGAERSCLLPTHEALALAGVALWDQPQKAAYYAYSNASIAVAAIENAGATSVNPGTSYASRAAEERAQTDLIRCIFVTLPFRPVHLAPSLLTWNDATIPKIAEAIYEDRAFERLPILADALEEAGCTDTNILDHCRTPGEHGRGCWPVDLVLGKS